MCVARLTSLLAALALLFAPIVMIGGAGTAMAASHHSGSAAMADPMAAHCAEMEGDGDHKSPDKSRADISCMVSCAMIPALPPRLAVAVPQARVLPALPASTSAGSLDPEAETPPPRFS